MAKHIQLIILTDDLQEVNTVVNYIFIRMSIDICVIRANKYKSSISLHRNQFADDTVCLFVSIHFC